MNEAGINILPMVQLQTFSSVKITNYSIIFLKKTNTYKSLAKESLKSKSES